jgi:hypothetical protein
MRTDVGEVLFVCQQLLMDRFAGVRKKLAFPYAGSRAACRTAPPATAWFGTEQTAR